VWDVVLRPRVIEDLDRLPGDHLDLPEQVLEAEGSSVLGGLLPSPPLGVRTPDRTSDQEVSGDRVDVDERREQITLNVLVDDSVFVGE
jgi:hypothetical protein